MADDEPLDIEIPEDLPEVEVVVEQPKPETEIAEAKVGSVDDEIAALKASVEREKLARIDAERRATESANIAAERTNESAESNLNLVNSAISTLQMTQDSLKSNLSAAFAAQDFDQAAEIQASMATNAATLQTLEQGKVTMEAAPKVQPAPHSNDPVEVLASQLSPRSAQWVRAHPEYARDQRLYSKMLAAHNLAAADGIPVDSDDYFTSIEDTLKISAARVEAATENALSDASAPVQRRSAPPAAPVSRSGTGDGSRPNRVTLSADEREMAQMAGLTDQEYAREKLKLINEGLLTKH